MIKRIISRFFMYAFLSVASFLSVFPLYWTVVSATNSSSDIIKGSLLAGTHLFQNFYHLLELYNLSTALMNSTLNAVVLTVASVIICAMAGYGFEAFHSKAKDKLMSILLLSMMIPFAAVMIPLFQLTANMGLLNTTLGFILPSLSTAFLILLFRQSTRSFPYEMIDSARIDGLNEISIFFRIFMPTMKSTFAAATVITFMSAWNSYLWPSIVFRGDPSAFTMPMLIARTIAGNVTDHGVVMLAALIATIPTIIIFFFLQKYFVEGIAGSIK